MKTLRFRNEAQRYTVVAVSLSGRFRPVIENMTVVTAATCAMVFSARVKKFVVCGRAENTWYCREETRPAGAAVVFHRRGKQRQASARTNKNAGAFFGIERAGAGVFGAFFA